MGFNYEEFQKKEEQLQETKKPNTTLARGGLQGFNYEEFLQEDAEVEEDEEEFDLDQEIERRHNTVRGTLQGVNLKDLQKDFLQIDENEVKGFSDEKEEENEGFFEIGDEKLLRKDNKVKSDQSLPNQKPSKSNEADTQTDQQTHSLKPQKEPATTQKTLTTQAKQEKPDT